MGSTKSSQYSKHILKQARTAKALGHPARITILTYLNLNDVAKLKDLKSITHLSESTLSKHIHELKQSELVKDTFFKHVHFFQLTPRAKLNIQKLLKVIEQ